MDKLRYRLGLDLGTNSLGWAVLELGEDDRPFRIVKAGSRIFSDGRDPKSGASLAVDRRDARAMRRRRDRFKQRQAALLKYLEKDGLFPADPAARKALAALDPYTLRARALDEALTLPEIGRALFHLNQRRGFQSNRKTDRTDGDAGKVETGVNRLRDAIEASGARTFGEFLHLRRLSADDQNSIPSVRTRLRPETSEGAKGDGYDFYPGRDLVKHEFREIWDAQAPHHPGVLTDAVFKHFYEIIFDQRPLKAPQIGMCTLVEDERRLPKAHPLFQQRRLLEEVNALMIVRPGMAAARLTPAERDLLLLKLKDKAKVAFETLRKTLKLDPAARFNKESDNRKELKGDEVASVMGTKTRFHTRWPHLSVEAQSEVISRLEAVETEADDKAFRTWLVDMHDLATEQATAVSKTHLPKGYGRFGPTATKALIAALTSARTPEGRLANAAPVAPGLVVVYSEAVQVAGLGHHSDMRDGQIFEDAKGVPELPYYGIALERHLMPGTGDPADPLEMRIGRLTNPTVHIGLNQIRRVVNALIRAYGPPEQIAVELARELKLSDDEKKQRNQENSRNRAEAEKRSVKLNETGLADTGANRARLKLWEELNPGNALDRRCVYSGQQISIEMLFSSAVEIDHILPFDATLDDSNGNKILCLREANREKRKRSPFEAWGHTDRWEDIAERASRLPRGKRWRFEPDAMQRFADQGGFLARHLVDTQYLGRLAREYLTALYPGEGEGSSHVWVSPGRLTEMVRRKLGLNSLLPDHNFGGGADQPKNRLDHRHHAIDAAVVAILDRGMLNRIARASGQGASDEEMRVMIPAPWDGFREDLKRTVAAITVAHRSDHGTVSKAGLKRGKDQTAGRLHNDTAYGFTGETDAKGNTIVVRRLALGALKKRDDFARVRDEQLRAALADFVGDAEGNAFLARLAEFPRKGPLDYRGLRRIRVVEPLTVIPIYDATGRAYKGYKGDSNYRYDVWEMPDGKWVTHWTDREGTALSSIVSMFAAHQSGASPRPHPAARKVLSLQQDDLVAIEQDGGARRIMRVVKFGQNGQITLAAHQESGDLKRRDAAANDVDPFKYIAPTAGGLKKACARRVRVDELGRVMDPGFPARKPKAVPPAALAAE